MHPTKQEFLQNNWDGETMPTIQHRTSDLYLPKNKNIHKPLETTSLKTTVVIIACLFNTRNISTFGEINQNVYIHCLKSNSSMLNVVLLKTLKNFMAPFYGWGSTASRLEPLRGDSLLFTTKFPEISGTHFTDLGRMKGWHGILLFDV